MRRIILLLALLAVVALVIAAPWAEANKKNKHQDVETNYLVQQTGVTTTGAQTLTMSCNAGDLVTGGGYSGRAQMQMINGDFPASTSSWEIDYVNPNPALATTLTGWADCLHQGK
jgi:hypothetical protein